VKKLNKENLDKLKKTEIKENTKVKDAIEQETLEKLEQLFNIAEKFVGIHNLDRKHSIIEVMKIVHELNYEND
jgi:putative ubiquitin-RnfH superfamily antitoxin RatB of RatAB toxin-antitoxin module